VGVYVYNTVYGMRAWHRGSQGVFNDGFVILRDDCAGRYGECYTAASTAL
jgi:hypothetical protein